MRKNIIKAVSIKYGVLFILLAALFIYVLTGSDISGSMFANIVATLVLLAIIPFALIYLIKKQPKK